MRTMADAAVVGGLGDPRPGARRDRAVGHLRDARRDGDQPADRRGAAFRRRQGRLYRRRIPAPFPRCSASRAARSAAARRSSCSAAPKQRRRLACRHAAGDRPAALFGSLSIGLAGYVAIVVQIVVMAVVTARASRYTVNRTLESHRLNVRYDRHRSNALTPAEPGRSVATCGARKSDAAALMAAVRAAAACTAVIVKLAVLGVLALALGFVGFVWLLPSQEVALDRDADGIVVLTGGASRLDDAVDLLASGRGKRLLISGVNPGTTTGDIAAPCRDHRRWFALLRRSRLFGAQYDRQRRRDAALGARPRLPLADRRHLELPHAARHGRACPPTAGRRR